MLQPFFDTLESVDILSMKNIHGCEEKISKNLNL